MLIVQPKKSEVVYNDLQNDSSAKSVSRDREMPGIRSHLTTGGHVTGQKASVPTNFSGPTNSEPRTIQRDCSANLTVELLKLNKNEIEIMSETEIGKCQRASRAF